MALGEGSLEATAGNQSRRRALSGSGVADAGCAGATVRVRDGCADMGVDVDMAVDVDVDVDDGIRVDVGVANKGTGEGCLAAGGEGARVPGAVWQAAPAASRTKSPHPSARRERRWGHGPTARVARWRTENTSTIFMGPIVTQLARWGKRTRGRRSRGDSAIARSANPCRSGFRYSPNGQKGKSPRSSPSPGASEAGKPAS